MRPTEDGRGNGAFAARQLPEGTCLGDYEGDVLDEAQYWQRYLSGVVRSLRATVVMLFSELLYCCYLPFACLPLTLFADRISGSLLCPVQRPVRLAALAAEYTAVSEVGFTRLLLCTTKAVCLQSDYSIRIDERLVIDGKDRAKDTTAFSPCHMNHSSGRTNVGRHTRRRAGRVTFYTLCPVEVRAPPNFTFGNGYLSREFPTTTTEKCTACCD